MRQTATIHPAGLVTDDSPPGALDTSVHDGDGDSGSVSPVPMTPSPECEDCADPPSSALHIPRGYVYALGRVELRFPTLGLEKEFAQAMGRSDTAGQTDPHALHTTLSKAEHRYLARKACWVFSIQGLASFLLLTRDSSELEQLIETLRPAPSPLDVDVIVDELGPLAEPALCNGLVVPTVRVDQLYSFDTQSLLKALPVPAGMTEAEFSAVAQEVFYRIMQLTDNSGATDEYRALNYLAVRYPAIYEMAANAHRRDMSLTDVTVRGSRLSGARKIEDVVFSYTHRKSGVVEKFFTRVDVTEAFPFLVTKLSPYFDR